MTIVFSFCSGVFRGVGLLGDGSLDRDGRDGRGTDGRDGRGTDVRADVRARFVPRRLVEGVVRLFTR